MLGARTLLGAPGIAIGSKDATRGSWPYYLEQEATRSKDAGLLALLLGARRLGAKTLLGAPGLTTSSKKLLGAPGILKDPTRGSWPYYLEQEATTGSWTLLEAPGLTTWNKKLLGAPGIAIRSKD